MTTVTGSFATVLGLLFVLGTVGWILYKFLENFQDSANGLTIGESLARQEADVAAKRERRRQTGLVRSERAEDSASAAPVGGRPRSAPAAGLGERRHVRDVLSSPGDFKGVPADAHRREISAENAHGDLAAFKHYPKIVYQCPFASEAHFKVLHPGEEAVDPAVVISTPEVYEAKARRTG